MKQIIPALRLLIFMTFLTGVVYPLLVTGIAQICLPKQANGNLMERNGEFIGSELIGQKFESDRYFWSRPSAIDYNPLPSGGTNLGPSSLDLKKAVDDRKASLKQRNPNSGEPPQDLLFTSASGLDPHISLEAAEFQIARVSNARGVKVTALRQLVAELAEKRQFGIFGEPRVNVLKLNLSIDALAQQEHN